MDRKGLTQAALARRARVSQATVSRALAGIALQRGRARSKLFIYAGIQEQPESQRPGQSTGQVVKAFEAIWDGTQSHARAVARIIEALGELRPKERKGKETA
jgi:arginine repressor